MKLEAPDGKLRETDCADTETILRIIQSIPSPRAEPFKQWLAQVGTDRLEEIENPEVLTARQRDYYIAKGYPEDWIEARQRGQVARNELTDTWNARGAEEGIEYAILTHEIATATFDVDVAGHMQIKGLERRNHLRDHMTRLELLLVEVGETATRAIHESRDSEGFQQLARDAHDGGAIAGRTRADIESQIGQSVVSPENYQHLAAGNPQAIADDADVHLQQQATFDETE